MPTAEYMRAYRRNKRQKRVQEHLASVSEAAAEERERAKFAKLGKASAAKLSKEERSARAKLGAAARWKKKDQPETPKPDNSRNSENIGASESAAKSPETGGSDFSDWNAPEISTPTPTPTPKPEEPEVKVPWVTQAPLSWKEWERRDPVLRELRKERRRSWVNG
jgi:hypothetical protein